MLLGSSHPYPWLILKESGLKPMMMMVREMREKRERVGYGGAWAWVEGILSKVSPVTWTTLTTGLCSRTSDKFHIVQLFHLASSILAPSIIFGVFITPPTHQRNWGKHMLIRTNTMPWSPREPSGGSARGGGFLHSGGIDAPGKNEQCLKCKK